VHLAFESIIDYSRFAIRIAQADMERVPEILKAVPPKEVERKQRALLLVWRK
jgi:hypothetical protein